MSVFMRAWKQVDMQSTPGYPYYMHDRNEEVDVADVYNRVSALLKSWRNCPLAMNRERWREEFEDGRLMPVTAFPKGEPTKKDKIVRLVFGGSLIMNVVERILFGDYLNHLKTTWRYFAHKVGMDFMTSEGCDDMMEIFERLRRKADQGGKELVSDDIQGWEWVDRWWMHEAWVKSFALNCVRDLTQEGYYLYMSYASASSMAPVVHDDGEVLPLPFHIMFSGKLTTHAQNSDCRSALAMIDARTDRVDLNITNGDDCIFVCDPEDAQAKSFESTKYGFVHTDVQSERDNYHFSSQVFWRHEDGEARRRPDGLAKLVYKLLTATDRAAATDIAVNAMQHPGFSHIAELLTAKCCSLDR